MVTPVDKRCSNKFCEFHNDKGHITNECMQLKKQIEELVKASKLSHFIKEIRQDRDKQKGGKKEAPAKEKVTAIYMIQPWQRMTRQKVMLSFAHVNEITFPPLSANKGTEGPLVIEAEIMGHAIHRMYVDGGSSMEILYEHCSNRLRPEIKSQMVPATTSLISFSGETIWPLGQLRLLVTIGDAKHFTKAWMNFMIVRSPSPYNGIIGSPGIIEIQVVPSTAHGMLKFPTNATIKDSTRKTKAGRENFKVAIHADFSDQEIALGGTLAIEGRTKLCALLKRNLDIFAWQPSDMTRVPWQKKRGQAPEQAKVIQAEVQNLVEAGNMREVYYHDWLSNPVLVKKHDGSWRMCVDFTDLNKACPQDCYPLSEIDWKSHTEAELLRDIEEMFCTLRKINMKLNPKKCTFRAVEGMFQGYMIGPEGIKPCPEKIEAVLQLPSLRTIKKVQSLNEKLAGLNRFLSKSAEKSLPLFKTMKKYIKKSYFYCTLEVEQAFKQLKQHISELPMLVAPRPKEELIMYLSASQGAVGAVLMTERDSIQTPVYFVSRALQGPELNYTPMKKPVLALVFVAKRVRSSQKAKNKKEDALSKITSTSFAHLSKQVLIEVLQEKSIQEKDVSAVVEEEGPTWMTPISEYLKDRVLPDDKKEANKLCIKARQYELMDGVHYKCSFLRPWLRCVGPFQADYMIREIHKGSCNMHTGPRSVVAKAMRSGYYWSTMHRDARDVILKCKDCQVHRLVPRNPQQPLAPITSPWPFYKWGIDIAGPFLERPGKVKFLIVTVDYFTKWIEANAVATISGSQVKKFVWDNIVCRFGLPGVIVSDNGKQFSYNPFKDWCEKLNITQRFASVKHPWSNRLMERANRSLGERIKARLGKGNKNWIEEIPYVLWAHRTMIKSSNGDTPLSLTYGTEAAIPAEIGMPAYRTTVVDVAHNDDEIRLNLDVLEERRKRAAIREAKVKSKMTKYYNARVRGVTFTPGDYVYRSNEASHAMDGGDLGPK
ncbi:reverse transcriptase domain-containing protein [Tanacetum coccineum]